MTYKHEFWRSIVKEVEQLRTYPGYRYVYFQSYAEFDAYMAQLGQPDWKTSPWGKVLLQTEEEPVPEYQLYHPDSVVASTAEYTANRGNYEGIARVFILQGVTDPYALKALIEKTPVQFVEAQGITTHTYRPKIAVLAAYIKKYSTQKRRVQTLTPAYIVQGLIEYYASQGYSLRQIAQKLRENEGIVASYETVRLYSSQKE
jgi:hypothetical protein